MANGNKYNYYPINDPNTLNFRNTIYALNISIEEHFSELLFQNDATRIIYSDNGNAFRKRAAGQPWNNLMLPFMNYHLESITRDTDRQWWNHYNNISGVWVESLQRKIRYTPIYIKTY